MLDSKDSILATIAQIFAPIFAPMGYGDWRICTSLVSGFMAKESVVSTLYVLYGSKAALTASLTPASGFALLIFCLLYTPCVAAVAAVKRELGTKWAAYVVVGQCVIAWICSFIAYYAVVSFV